MSNKNANIGARLDRLPNSGWHIKMWLVSAFALLVCWSNGIGGAVQNILLNELHWLEPGSTLLAMWGTTYTAGQLFGALAGGPIGDKIGRKKSILLYEVIHIIAMIGGAAAPNVTVLYVFRLIQGFGLGALLVVLFAAFTEYVPGKNRGVWSSRNSFSGGSDILCYRFPKAVTHHPVHCCLHRSLLHLCPDKKPHHRMHSTKFLCFRISHFPELQVFDERLPQCRSLFCCFVLHRFPM